MKTYLNFLFKIFLINTLVLFGGELKAQTTDTSFTFTEQQVIKLDSIIQSQEQVIKIQREKIQLLESQLFNYGLLHQQDSLHISLLNKNVELLSGRVDLYIDLNKELKPKWYNKPVIHFFLGAVTITTSAVVLNLIQ